MLYPKAQSGAERYLEVKPRMLHRVSYPTGMTLFVCANLLRIQGYIA